MKALFLDIDGVLQPCGRQERFAHIDEIPSLCKQLNETVKNEEAPFPLDATLHTPELEEWRKKYVQI